MSSNGPPHDLGYKYLFSKPELVRDLGMVCTNVASLCLQAQ
jgi:hypothetical protein